MTARLREWFTRPILVLSASNQESDKVAALDMGADDYMTKPFGGADTNARVEIDGLSIDLAALRVRRDSNEIRLTPLEYKLLVALARHRGKVLTHRHLLREVWDAAHVESPQYLRIFMRALRNKIEPDPTRPRYLLTQVGIGYRLADS